MKIRHIFIQGAGTMGSGIAQVSAQAGFEVIMMDLSMKFVLPMPFWHPTPLLFPLQRWPQRPKGRIKFWDFTL